MRSTSGVAHGVARGLATCEPEKMHYRTSYCLPVCFSPQAIRLLVGWLRERRATADAAAATAVGGHGQAGPSRSTYDIDWRQAKRAMQVIRE